MHNTFKEKFTSTLNVKMLANPLSTLNVKTIYIKCNIFTLKPPKCKKIYP